MEQSYFKKVRWVLLAFAIAAVFGGTHWLAYREGKKDEHKKTVWLAEEFWAQTPPDVVKIRTELLRVASEHPGSLSENQMRFHTTNLKGQLEMVEKLSIPHAERSGNTDEEQRWREIAASAHQVLEKMPK